MSDRGSLRELLRSETGALHERLEASVPLLDPALDRARYAQILAAMLRVYRPLERRLVAMPIAGLAPARDHKTEWLERDLAALGHPLEVIAAIPESRHLPTVASEADAVGCRYVLEGATLGGSIISRHVVDHLGLAHGGAAFFSGYRSDTRDRWRQFVAVLDRWGGDHHAQHGAVLVAASATFLALEHELHDSRE